MTLKFIAMIAGCMLIGAAGAAYYRADGRPAASLAGASLADALPAAELPPLFLQTATGAPTSTAWPPQASVAFYEETFGLLTTAAAAQAAMPQAATTPVASTQAKSLPAETTPTETPTAPQATTPQVTPPQVTRPQAKRQVMRPQVAPPQTPAAPDAAAPQAPAVAGTPTTPPMRGANIAGEPTPQRRSVGSPRGNDTIVIHDRFGRPIRVDRRLVDPRALPPPHGPDGAYAPPYGPYGPYGRYGPHGPYGPYGAYRR